MKKMHLTAVIAAALLLGVSLVSCTDPTGPADTSTDTSEITDTDTADGSDSAASDSDTEIDTLRAEESADTDTEHETAEADTTSMAESDTDTSTEADTAADSETAESEPAGSTDTVTPDPSTVTLMIEDFNHMTDLNTTLSPIDLSTFGVSPPAYRVEAEFAQEGKAFVAIPSTAAWCQAYQITGERLGVFTQATEGLYLRIYVCTPDNLSVALTFALHAGNQKSFLDPTVAIVTRRNGESLTCTTANASDDAGENSSILIPAGFEGYLAFPMTSLKPWASNTSVSDLTTVDYLKIDVRPSGMVLDDRYVLDALCLTDSPVAEIDKSGLDANKPIFTTKNEELNYMFDKILSQDVTFEYCPEFDPTGYPNVKALWIEGADMGGHKTKFFAFIGFPEGASAASPVPAVVLNHGGGGYAFAPWVDIWVKRGYAAIAIGNTGYAPAVPGMPDCYSNDSWTHTLTPEMLEKDPRILPPNNDGMFTSTGPIDCMWMYHAVSETILANTLLRQDERVITDKVGITGISWGGVITSIAIGYDSRFAFAIPVYGSGYLHESLSWMKQHFNAEGTKELWDASLKLKSVKMPVLWLAWTNDNCFSINTNDKSFGDTENGALTFLMDLGHGHLEGWAPAEIYRFADSIVKGGEGLTTCRSQPSGGGDISFAIDPPADATSVTAKVYYLTEPMTYSADSQIEQTWQRAAATVTGNTVTATIPADACSYYVEISTVANGQTYVTCSRYITLA